MLVFGTVLYVPLCIKHQTINLIFFNAFPTDLVTILYSRVAVDAEIVGVYDACCMLHDVRPALLESDLTDLTEKRSKMRRRGNRGREQRSRPGPESSPFPLLFLARLYVFLSEQLPRAPYAYAVGTGGSRRGRHACIRIRTSAPLQLSRGTRTPAAGCSPQPAPRCTAACPDALIHPGGRPQKKKKKIPNPKYTQQQTAAS